MAKTIAVYIRVSTTGQNEAGQRAAINEWLTAHGHDPKAATWYADKHTGATMDRPALDRLQAAIFAGKHATVVTWRLDRLSRNLRDGINVLCDWCEAGLRVVAITQQIDFSGTQGKMIASVLLGVAEMELEAIKERQRVGIVAAKERGVYQGRKQGTTKAKPARAKELRDNGLKQNEIAAAMGVSRTTVNRYLRNAE
jgi:DNA invertase Pin-like site-specific DNA recombinase